MKQFYSLALAAFICVLCSFGARAQAENGTDNILYQSVGHGTPYPHESWNQYTNIAGAPNVEVIVYNDNSIRVNGWAGVGGYDFILTHDDSDLKSITSLHDGVAEDIDPDKFIIKTGSGDGRDFYISPGYCKIYVDANKGAIFLQGFLFGDGNPEQYVYYYIEWPLTAEEIIASINADFTNDCNLIQEWENALNEICETYPEYAASDEGAATLSAISDKFANLPAEIEEAKTTALNRWGGYASPITNDIRAEIFAAIGNAQDAAKAFSENESIIYEALGHATIYDVWGATGNIAPAQNLQVYVLNGKKIRINAWAGVEGYDIIFDYDDNWDILSWRNVINGVEGESHGQGFATAYTGNGDEILDVYLNEGEDMAKSEDGAGCVWIAGFLNDTDNGNYNYVYYYVEWPLTADELTLKIEAAHKADSDQINEWISTINSIREDYPEFAASQDGVEIIEPISEEVMDYSSDVDSAYAVAYKHWGYKSPLNEEIIEDINDSLDFAMEVAQGFDGIESITIDVNGESNFFDIYGRPVDNPVAGSIVIKVANGVASKVFVK